MHGEKANVVPEALDVGVAEVVERVVGVVPRLAADKVDDAGGAERDAVGALVAVPQSLLRIQPLGQCERVPKIMIQDGLFVDKKRERKKERKKEK